MRYTKVLALATVAALAVTGSHVVAQTVNWTTAPSINNKGVMTGAGTVAPGGWALQNNKIIITITPTDGGEGWPVWVTINNKNQWTFDTSVNNKPAAVPVPLPNQGYTITVFGVLAMEGQSDKFIFGGSTVLPKQ
jgi:hypothetical protein